MRHVGVHQDGLHKYLVAAVPGFPAQARLEVRQFQHGQSNPTYLLRALPAGGAPAHLFVLRKKPPGQVCRGLCRCDVSTSQLCCL